jgi:hypothetical protein
MTTITNFIRKCISAALLLCCCIGFATSSSAQTIYALSGNNLISFDAQTPATIPITGALAFTDTPLAYAAGDANAASNPSIGAVAYTNSFNGTTTTTLYNYDDSLNIFTIQNLPNNGTLNTLGASGITLNLGDPSADFDIYYDFGTQTNRAYLSANTGTSTFDDLYTVDLPATGTAALVGKIGLGIAVTDLTAFLRTQATLACPSDTTILLFAISKRASRRSIQ